MVQRSKSITLESLAAEVETLKARLDTVSIEAAARMLKKSRRTVERYIASGDLHPESGGIPRAEVQALKERTS